MDVPSLSETTVRDIASKASDARDRRPSRLHVRSRATHGWAPLQPAVFPIRFRCNHGSMRSAGLG
jgi:hypothetical protein